MPFIRVPKLSGAHPLVLANAVQVRLHWSFNGILGFNVLAGSVGGGYVNSQAHANALGTAVLGHFTSSGLAALMATTTSLLHVGIRDLRVANQVEYVSAAAAVPGTGAGNPLPNELAAVVTLRTAQAGKSFRGRAYFGGAIVGENTAAGQIAAGFNTALATFMTNVQTDMTAEGITLSILSRPRFANLTPPADVQTYAGALTPVTAILTRDIEWDTQRRRKH
jgi:hypothetical protein